MTETDLAFRYVLVSLFVAAFWYGVTWLVYRPFALMVGFVVFLLAFAFLAFGYGAYGGGEN